MDQARITIVEAETFSYDRQLYSVPDATAKSICNEVKRVPYSGSDRVHGQVRVRPFEEWEVVCMISQSQADRIIIAMLGIRPPLPEPIGKRLMRFLKLIALGRGITGV